MKFDLVEKRTFYSVLIISFLVFLFLPLELGMKIFLFSLATYFFVLFFLCSYWAGEWHPERKFIIGFLVSFLHTFVFLFSGIFGLILAIFISKISPYLIEYLKGVFKF